MSANYKKALAALAVLLMLFAVNKKLDAVKFSTDGFNPARLVPACRDAVRLKLGFPEVAQHYWMEDSKRPISQMLIGQKLVVTKRYGDVDKFEADCLFDAERQIKSVTIRRVYD